jgi:protease I
MESRKTCVALLVHDQYQELEFWYPLLRLREAGIDVKVIGAEPDHTYHSRLGYPVIADYGLAEVAAEDFDAVIVPGGGAANSIGADFGLVAFVTAVAAAGKPVAALSEASRVLGKAGLLGGKRVSAVPDARATLLADGATCGDDAVTVDGLVVTSRGVNDIPAFFRIFSDLVAVAT